MSRPRRSPSGPGVTLRPRPAALGWLAVGCAGALGGALGHGPSWLLAAGVVAALTLAPLLARAQLLGLELRGPHRLALHPGQARLVEGRMRGAGRDLLVRLAEPDRLERARPLAVPRVGTTWVPVLLDLRVQQRGRLEALEADARTSFPFGLFEARWIGRLACDVSVRPRLLREGPWSRAALAAEREGLELGRSRDPAGEFFALREWRAGEPPRRVRWSASARRGRWLVDERRGAQRAPSHVVLIGTGAGPGMAFERAVSAAAALAELLGRSGRPVAFSFIGSGARHDDRHGVAAALDALAQVEGVRGEAVSAVAALPGAIPTAALVVVAPEPGCPREALCAALPGAVVVMVEASGEPEVRRARALRGAVG